MFTILLTIRGGGSMIRVSTSLTEIIMSSTAIYTRVSSKSQDTASQLPDLRKWEAVNSPATWYTDKATGANMDRPGFEKILAGVRDGSVKIIVVWRLDRLGRTAMGLTALFHELRERKVNLVSIRDGLDLSTPAGNLMANVLASVAQFEKEVRSERQTAGIAVAKSKGVQFGRPATGIGTGKRIKVTVEQEQTVRRLAAEGQGKTMIARTVGLSRPTVYAILG
jgi:DNA invertase Pin-like site-specific DNA recombinase